MVSTRKDKTEVDERIDKYVEEQRPAVPDAKDVKRSSTMVTDWINTRVQRTSIGDSIARQLARADLKFKPGEYIALMIIASFMLGLVGYVIGGKSPYWQSPDWPLVHSSRVCT